MNMPYIIMLREQRLRTWETLKDIADRTACRDLTDAEMTAWENGMRKMEHLDRQIEALSRGGTTHWSGPPVSGGGGGGGFGWAEVTAIGDRERSWVSLYPDGNAALTPEQAEARDRREAERRAQPIFERTCEGCGIGEFSRIGAGPFVSGRCRYCADLHDRQSAPKPARRTGIPADQSAGWWSQPLRALAVRGVASAILCVVAIGIYLLVHFLAS
jgi:hypothetical protein